jgi:hypothetical protein
LRVFLEGVDRCLVVAIAYGCGPISLAPLSFYAEPYLIVGLRCCRELYWTAFATLCDYLPAFILFFCSECEGRTGFLVWARWVGPKDRSGPIPPK